MMKSNQRTGRTSSLTSISSSSEYEKKLVHDIIQPGGVRVKPPDDILNAFTKACESLHTSLIGSLLISKLYLDLPWMGKAVKHPKRTQWLILIRKLCLRSKPWLKEILHT
jgi:hypothetical protein